MSTATKTNPALWERAKSQAKSRLGGHSARAMQLAVKIYKSKGGGYKGGKKSSNKLSKWSKQKWRTKSGKPSKETGERYLPSKVIKNMSSSEYAASTRAKRKGGGTGNVVPQPKGARKKLSNYLKIQKKS